MFHIDVNISYKISIFSKLNNFFIFSFAAVDYCIRNKIISRYFDDPAILYCAALLGPLRATTVESFAAKRTEEFRQKCRDVLLGVEKLASSPVEWERAVGNSVVFISSKFLKIFERNMRD